MSNILRPHLDTVTIESRSINYSINCPHCGSTGTFENPTARLVSYIAMIEPKLICETAIMQCPSTECGGFALLAMNNNGVHVLPAIHIDFDTSNIPDKLSETLGEAIQCHGAGAYRASAIMVRRLLEILCEHDGAEGRTLAARLEVLREKIVLPQALFDAMEELKLIGNDAAHVEARAYDEIGADEAAECIELSKEILKSRFQLESLVDRLRRRKGIIQSD